MKLLACILLFCFAATAFGQFNICRMKSERILITRRVCQRYCLPFRGQYVTCPIVLAGRIISTCSPNCCRMDNSCHRNPQIVRVAAESVKKTDS